VIGVMIEEELFEYVERALETNGLRADPVISDVGGELFFDCRPVNCHRRTLPSVSDMNSLPPRQPRRRNIEGFALLPADFEG
jgi:hypothetical protein